MKPVFQDKFGYGKGNCLAACIASILEVPLSDIPEPKISLNNWWLLNTWLFDQGYVLAWVRGTGEINVDSPGYYIANGMSPRGLRHSVIWSKDGLIHDPHPEGGGIDKPNDFFFIIPCKQNTDYLKDMRDMLN